VDNGVLAGADVLGATVFHFDRTDSGLEVVIGSEGQAFRGPVTVAGSRLEVESELSIRDYGNPNGWPEDNGVTVERLSLCVHPPREGRAALDGSGKLLVVSNSDDSGDQYEVDADFTGAPLDETPPTLPGSLTIDPLRPDALPVSEPLALGAQVALANPTGIAFSPVDQAGTVVAFLPVTILPLGFRSEVTMDGRDLANNSFNVYGDVVGTVADPGVWSLDDPDADSRVITFGASHVGPFLTPQGPGFRVEGGVSALVHLARPNADARHVRFELQSDPVSVTPPASFEVRAGVYWGSDIVTQEIPIPTEPPAADTGEAGAAGASGSGAAAPGVTAVDLVLAEEGADVLLEITAPITRGTIPTAVGAIVERLRVE
jgi:hypothetical protein